jgi:GT2 family glycosyltransferase
MVKDKKVTAVVVTYNRKKLLKECITSLINSSYKNLNILIVDNHSTDDTFKYIKSYVNNKNVRYIDTGSNLGGAGGFNFGIKEAYKLETDFIWIMDDDCIVHDDTLENLILADKKLNSNYGFLCSKVLWKDGTLSTMNITRDTVFKPTIDFSSELVKVSLATFVSLFVPTKVIENVGLPIKEFFIWTDDWEYTRRISKKYNCYLANKSIVTHKSKSNIGVSIVDDSKERLDRYKYVFRNDVYYYKKEGILGVLYVFLRQFYYLFKILFSNTNNKLIKIKIVFKNTFKGFSFHPIIEQVK